MHLPVLEPEKFFYHPEPDLTAEVCEERQRILDDTPPKSLGDQVKAHIQAIAYVYVRKANEAR